ncbi:16S rRNA (adenine(1518)-N(6)/adenine(1519)-N(6))-dimethyltransferase RsmA [Candidatus Uabimicrobium sp. HlEnr_7]|uniref:16S rRNA (adenine(1518)-N(6)/adenine(1519)-N(6))- dimethyltransferase RsmA n=1 Tax=Candidatus Uabimicrobium helgolandensis TaxID=3095367 RepID=UPI00355798E9
MFPTSPKKLEKYLTYLGAAPQKKWGQNFLLDTSYHVAIKSAAELSENDVVLEIGAGLGHLTQFLQPFVHKLYIVEIDPLMVKALQSSFVAAENLEIISEDILQKKRKLNPLVLQKIKDSIDGFDFKIIANLPYNISAPIIVNFLSTSLPISKMIFMVQKEIAERIIAEPKTEFYGPLTVQTQIYASVKILKYVPAEAFFPAPKVTSAIIEIVPHNKLLHTINNIELFKRLVQSTFCLRRKKIANSLKKGANLPEISKDNLDKIEEHFDLSRRPETFSVEEFIHMANIIDSLDK